MLFGAKSEKIVLKLEQLELQLEEEETTQAEGGSLRRARRQLQEPKPRPERKPLPEHLPREVVTHVPERDCCPDCGGQLRQFGEDVTEQLEYIPENFKVIRHVRPKFACTGCDRVVEAPAPSRPIERGLAGPGFWPMCSSRSSPIICRSIASRRSTLAREWRSRAPRWPDGSALRASCSRPLVAALRQACPRGPQAACRRYADSGACAGQRQDQDRPPLDLCARRPACWRGHCSRSLVRLLGRSQGRTSTPASEELQGRAAGRRLRRLPSSLWRWHIYEVACWAHARRKFHEIHVIHASPTTTEALASIGALYAIEDEIRGKPAELRLDIRQTRARPLLDELRKWMEKTLRSLSRKSETAAAIRYALSRWRALTRYTEDGLLEIDNSAAERALRAVALGRKNYLFAGSDCGGERAAAMYSLIGSAKLNGLDPELYLRGPCSRRSPTIPSATSRNCCHGTWLPFSRPTHHKPLRHALQVPT